MTLGRSTDLPVSTVGVTSPSALDLLTSPLIATGIVASFGCGLLALVAGDSAWGWLAASIAIGALTTAFALAPHHKAATLGAVADAVAHPERFRMLADALPIPVLLSGPDCRTVLFANEAARARFGLAAGAGADRDTIEPLGIDPEWRQSLADTVMRDGVVEQVELELRSADGTPFWALVAARRVTFDGAPAILAGFYDISDRKAAEEALLASEVRHALIARASHDGIWDWDLPSGRVYYSARWRELAGADAGRRLNRIEDWFTRVHPDDLPKLEAAIDDHLEGRTPLVEIEYRLRHGAGDYRWMDCRGIVLRNGAGLPIRMAGSQSDITLRKSYELSLHNAAYEDGLTGIGNRAAFTKRAQAHETQRSLDGSAVALVNVDRFRRINDNLGQETGDALLVAIARRLRSCIRAGDAIARLDGDEFALWLETMTDTGAAGEFVTALLGTLNQPYELDGSQVRVTFSAGLAVPGPRHTSCGADLVSHARLALDRAKAGGANRLVSFDESLLTGARFGRRLSRDLDGARAAGQIWFAYQPVITLGLNGDTRIAGFEALMRWHHPELGLVSPAQFIPIAEETGLIGPLGLFAVEQAAERIDAWTRPERGNPQVSISVNLSARQIADNQGVKSLLDAIDRLKLPPRRLKLEITESVMMRDPERTISVCHELRARGVDLSLDDFGTGYSSLSYLHRFPVSELKIDRSFVSRMESAPEALRLVRSIIELAHDLGLDVVAEGVEREAEAQYLAELGCDFAQGFLFAPPLPIQEATILLDRGAGPPLRAAPVSLILTR